jgi:hypothetical protein
MQGFDSANSNPSGLPEIARPFQPQREYQPALSKEAVGGMASWFGLLNDAKFVWFVWLCTTSFALYQIVHYSGNMPYWDEFSLVPYVTHEKPITVQWLWDQHNEHRIPLPKLIQIGLAEITRTDFRAGMYFNVLAMSVLAAILLRAIVNIRGCHSYTDAFVPIALLHTGHNENFLWSFQVAFASSTFLIGILLVQLIGVHRPGLPPKCVPSTRQLMLAGFCLLLLPFFGAQGVLIAAPVSIWMGVVGWRLRVNHPRRGWEGIAAMFAAILTVAFAICYLIGYSSPAHHHSPPSLGAWLKTAMQFLSVGFGPGVRSYCTYTTCSITAVLIVTTVVLRSAWISSPVERQNILGLSLLIAGMLLLALAIGKGRSFLSSPGCEPGVSSRYALLSVPLLIVCYLVASKWAKPLPQRFIHNGLLLLSLLVLPRNFKDGHALARANRERNAALAATLHASSSPETVPPQVSERFFPDRSEFINCLQLIRAAHAGPYRSSIEK